VQRLLEVAKVLKDAVILKMKQRWKFVEPKPAKDLTF
jgi:hypothetical protein